MNETIEMMFACLLEIAKPVAIAVVFITALVVGGAFVAVKLVGTTVEPTQVLPSPNKDYR